MHLSFSQLTAAGLALIMAAEAAAVPVSAETREPIEAVTFANVSTALTVGAVPDYTAYLTGDALMHAGILNEGWGCLADLSVHASKSEGLPVPDDHLGVPYCYLIALTADEGWYFPEDISVIYEDALQDSSSYYATVTDEGQTLMLRCMFIPPVTPQLAEGELISTVQIDNAVLAYSAGEAPRFTAVSAEPEKYSVQFERWVDDLEPTRFLTSSEEVNAEMGLADSDRLTAFALFGQYHYDICIAAAPGCKFTDEVLITLGDLSFYAPDHSRDMIPANDVKVLVVQEAPAETTTTVTETTATVTETTTTITETTATVTETTTTVTETTTTITETTTTVTETTTTVTETTAADPETQAQTVPVPADILPGDVNQDGRVSVSDAVLLFRLLTENCTFLLSEAGALAADLDQDGVTDLRDAAAVLRILRQSGGTVTVLPPLPAEADTSGYTLPESEAPAWLLTPDGSSQAFSIQPAEGLTVSAAENALSYDGQLRITALTDEDGAMLDETASERGGILLDGWRIDAGLRPDQHLPGSYVMEYDLRQAGIPEEMYGEITAMRLDDNGELWEYTTTCEDGVLRWECDQNCWSLIVTVPILIWVGYKFKTETYDAETKEREIWTAREKEALTLYRGANCNIIYADNETIDEKNAREDRIREIEAETEKEMRRQAEEAVQNDWLPFGSTGWGYTREVNRKTAARKQQALAENNEYQELLAARRLVPADVLLLDKQFSTALLYLQVHEGCPSFGNKPDVLFTEALSIDGAAMNPTWHASYLHMHRNDYTNMERVEPETEFYNIYGDPVDKAYADKLLVTMTHEIYHLYQNKKISAHNRANLKFSEMSAMFVDHRCGKHFLENSYIESYSEVISQTYETLACGIDNNEPDENILIAQGYALCNFWEHAAGIRHIEVNGWQMLCAFRQYGSISAMMRNLLGLEVSAGDDLNRVLDAYWKSFQYSVAAKSKSISADLWNRNSDDPNEGYYPSLMKKFTLSGDRTQAYAAVKPENLSCTLVGIQGAASGSWSAIAVRDENFTELLPTHQFMMQTAAGGKSGAAESRSGLVMTAKQQMLYYRERLGSGNLSKSGYTLHYIPAPQKPDVTVDQDAETVTVVLRSAPSAEGAGGLTDRFVIVCTVNGTETLALPVSYESWQEPVTLHFSDLQLNMNQKSDLRITVCEQIDAAGDYAACRTAESEAFSAQLGETVFPSVDLACDGNGTVGAVGVGPMKARFVLSPAGSFTIAVESTSYAPSGDPFADEQLGTWDCSGFTVTGDASKGTGDTSSWIAAITGCTADSFTAHSELTMGVTDGIGYGNVSEYVTDIVSCTGQFEGGISGTVQYQLDADTNRVTVSLRMSPTIYSMQEHTVTDPEGNVKEGRKWQTAQTSDSVSMVFQFTLP